MTVCKTFTRVPLAKGHVYKRAELICDMSGPEKMVFTYYDPPRDELRTFFDEDNNDWISTYDAATGILRFSHCTLTILEETPAWERTKIRHVFLHRKNQSKGEYEYLGTAIDESRATIDGHDERQFDIR